MTNKEYFDRLVELTPADWNIPVPTYSADTPGCWNQLYFGWESMLMSENIFSHVLRYIIFDKSPEMEDDEVRNLYAAISEALLNCDEALLAWGSMEAMFEAIAEVCYDTLAEEGEESPEAFRRYLHCCLVEKLFSNRDPAKLFEQGHTEAYSIYIPYGYEYYAEYKQKYRDCTMRLFPDTKGWPEAEWLEYDHISWCFALYVSVGIPVYIQDDMDAVYYYFMCLDRFDCKLSQPVGGMISADLDAFKAFKAIFGNSRKAMYDYVRYCLTNRDCKLNLKDYKNSWIYYLIENFVEDKDDPRHKEAKRMLFDIQMMAST